MCDRDGSPCIIRRSTAQLGDVVIDLQFEDSAVVATSTPRAHRRRPFNERRVVVDRATLLMSSCSLVDVSPVRHLQEPHQLPPESQVPIATEPDSPTKRARIGGAGVEPLLTKTILPNSLDTRRLLAFRPVDCAIELVLSAAPSHPLEIIVPTFASSDNALRADGGAGRRCPSLSRCRRTTARRVAWT